MLDSKVQRAPRNEHDCSFEGSRDDHAPAQGTGAPAKCSAITAEKGVQRTPRAYDRIPEKDGLRCAIRQTASQVPRILRIALQTIAFGAGVNTASGRQRRISRIR
jgi:hypothetical protein